MDFSFCLHPKLHSCLRNSFDCHSGTLIIQFGCVKSLKCNKFLRHVHMYDRFMFMGTGGTVNDLKFWGIVLFPRLTD